MKNLASFSEEKSAWVVEKGQYGIWVGDSSVNLEISGVLEVAEDTVIETVRHILPLQEKLEELTCPEEIRMGQEKAWKEAAAAKGLQLISFLPHREEARTYEEHEAARAARELMADSWQRS